MARMLLKEGTADESANHLRATLRANPADVGAHIMMGNYLLRRDQPTQAIGEYEAALRVNPSLREVKVELGMLYAKTGRLPHQAARRIGPNPVAPRGSRRDTCGRT